MNIAIKRFYIFLFEGWILSERICSRISIGGAMMLQLYGIFSKRKSTSKRYEQ